MLYWLINLHGTCADVAKNADALTFEACRSAPPPFQPPKLENPRPEDMVAAVKKHEAAVAAHNADCEIERGSFAHALGLVKAELAHYPEDAVIGVTARRVESPRGSGQFELSLSIGEHTMPARPQAFAG